MDKQGDILLEYHSSDNLHMYEFKAERYIQKWVKKFPAEIDSKYACHKCMNDHGEIFLQNGEDKGTVCFSNSLQKQYVVSHKGKLQDISDGDLFYLENFGDNRHKIVVYKGHGTASTSRKGKAQKPEDPSEVVTLLPQWERMAKYPSVCRVQQYYVVVEYWNQALDVFNLQGIFLLACVSSGWFSTLFFHIMDGRL